MQGKDAVKSAPSDILKKEMQVIVGAYLWYLKQEVLSISSFRLVGIPLQVHKKKRMFTLPH